jgi:hypothetical protein
MTPRPNTLATVAPCHATPGNRPLKTARVDVKCDTNQRVVYPVSGPIYTLGGPADLNWSAAPMGAIVTVAKMKSLTSKGLAQHRLRDSAACGGFNNRRRTICVALVGGGVGGHDTLTLKPTYDALGAMRCCADRLLLATVGGCANAGGKVDRVYHADI